MKIALGARLLEDMLLLLNVERLVLNVIAARANANQPSRRVALGNNPRPV
jgi:hypothetical protein